jgi:hypothetical protein
MRQQAQTVQADVVPINITGTLCWADTVGMSLGEWLWLVVQYMFLVFCLYMKVSSCGLASCSLICEGTSKTPFVCARKISVAF